VATKFGILSKLEFLQDWASSFIAGLNPAVTHNLEKYEILKKIHYLSAIEETAGDYLEFGVFTGSSFCHSMRCVRKLARLRASVRDTRFFGFDSFAGFGELAGDDVHPFYTDENFATSLAKVEARARRASHGLTFRLVPGFFEKSLAPGPAHFGIERARVVFLDSDTYASAHAALTFCLPVVSEGSFLVLDDYFSYRGARDRGVARAFAEFVEEGQFDVRQVFTYGMGGAAYVVAGRTDVRAEDEQGAREAARSAGGDKRTRVAVGALKAPGRRASNSL
jgi:O-methyltransferase